MNAFTTVLYFLSSAMLVPVVVLLIGLFGWSFLTLGAFFREYIERHRRLNQLLRQGQTEEEQEESLKQIITESASVDEAMLKMDGLLDEIELRVASRLEKTDLACRVAPMLGLMGTLIPLGPALMALAAGDVETLAKNLVVAFTTTVIGLATSAISLWVSTVRRRWYDSDMREITQMANRLLWEDKKEVGDEFSLRKMDAAKQPREASSP